MKVFSDAHDYVIIRDNGTAYVQRKHPADASHTSLSMPEVIIGEMCAWIERSRALDDLSKDGGK